MRVSVREMVRVLVRVSGGFNDVHIRSEAVLYTVDTYTCMHTPSSMTIAATSAVLEGSQAKSEWN